MRRLILQALKSARQRTVNPRFNAHELKNEMQMWKTPSLALPIRVNLHSGGEYPVDLQASNADRKNGVHPLIQ